MSKTSNVQDKSLVEAATAESGGGGVSLGKGAWDCDTNTEIPPEKEVRRERFKRSYTSYMYFVL